MRSRTRALFLPLFCAACVCSRTPDGKSENGADNSAAKNMVQAFAFDGARATTDLAEVAKTPHPFGSMRQAEVLQWLTSALQKGGAIVTPEPFTAQVPNPAITTASGPQALTLDRSGTNLYATGILTDDAGCVVLIATHSDTKDLSFTSYLGANDSGSSTVALLQQLAFLKTQRGAANLPACDVAGVFFDAEEAVLPNWNDGETRHPAKIQDNTYGSRYAANRLTTCDYQGQPAKCLPADIGGGAGGKPVVAIILMDMIGSPALSLSQDTNSTAKLRTAALAGAQLIGKADLFDSKPTGVEDDHTPFRLAGIPGLDLIDFNNLQYWHQAGDDPDHISTESIGLAAKLAMYVALQAAAAPKVFLAGAE